jgi:NAD(P)-dependent dehydrogenase (short-subunit alcohol dehydrogenase family)
MSLLKGKVAIITGAGGGIGREHALYFAKEGAKVVVNDLGGDRSGGGKGSAMADGVVAEIKAAGGEAIANYDSVATREGADSLMWTAQSKYGQIDILLNNAGVLRDRSILNLTENDWDVVQNVHLKGTFFCTQAAARIMKLQGHGGRIINTTSVSGLMGNFGQGNYAAAKAGIYGFTRTAAIEFGRYGISVNALAPVALTRMTEDLKSMSGESKDVLGAQHVAPVAAFLASDLAGDITGQIVGVHGPRVFVYRMETTAGINRESGGWTPNDIKEQWSKIVG